MCIEHVFIFIGEAPVDSRTHLSRVLGMSHVSLVRLLWILAQICGECLACVVCHWCTVRTSLLPFDVRRGTGMSPAVSHRRTSVAEPSTRARAHTHTQGAGVVPRGRARLYPPHSTWRGGGAFHGARVESGGCGKYRPTPVA